MTTSAQPPRHGEDDPGLRVDPDLLARFQRFRAEEAAADDEHGLPSQLARAAKRVLGVDGAGLCVQTSPGLRLPLGSSDAASATAERLQFTVGEGPCFQAMADRRPLVVTALSMRERWPVLAVLHREATPFTGSLVVPLRAGQLCFGALDLYLTRPRALDGRDVVAGQVVARVVADVLLDTLEPVAGAGSDGGGDAPGSWWNGPAVRARREVWVAAGMANLTLGLRQDDALAVLRAHAVLRGQSLDALAHDVVFGGLDLVELTR
jgi:hypothetical protein